MKKNRPATRDEPTYTWAQIELAILAINDRRITAAATYGLSAEEGCRMARARMCDDVRRKLEQTQ